MMCKEKKKFQGKESEDSGKKIGGVMGHTNSDGAELSSMAVVPRLLGILLAWLIAKRGLGSLSGKLSVP